MVTEAELAGFYRLLDHERVTPDALLAPHYDATRVRSYESAEILVVHDTTQFRFPGEDTREGLSRTGKGKQGFFAHVSLVVSADGERCPYGVVDHQTWSRAGVRRKGKVSHRERYSAKDLESLRWGESVRRAHARLAPRRSPIHVMDREADDFRLFCQLDRERHRFLVRLTHDRQLSNEDGTRRDAKLFEVMSQVPAVAHRQAHLSPRARKLAPAARRRHPARGERTAKLEIAATRVLLRRPSHAPRDWPEALEFTAIDVREVDCPEGMEPVSWRLITSEPAETAAQVLWLVDCYRARWLIEEYFRAIKSGCAFEKRQLETLPRLQNALALFIPIAWQMLLLRSLSRSKPDAPAETVLTPTQLVLLKEVAERPLSRRPTLNEALYAIARLGGHITRRGDPGWITIGRGFEKLRTMEFGFRAAAQVRPASRPQDV